MALILMGGLLGGCSTQESLEHQEPQEGLDPIDNSIDAAARLIVAGGSTKAFENEGIVVAGDLECTATSGGGVSDISVECIGTGTEGEELAVEATLQADAGPGGTAQGSFVGTADGKEVFSAECFGAAC
ncbi:MAG: hypothetical protein ACRDHI_09575 [Actinomycetota bacterium]